MAEASEVTRGQDEEPRNPTVVEIGPVSRERREALAVTLARVLVARALSNPGLTPLNDNRIPR